ncbi:MAG: DUF2156 domain-containing protein [Thermoplasmatales archaeon]|nr:MAG: DUF2156 domain-containing protein [Thermoplasmatales archaeon]
MLSMDDFKLISLDDKELFDKHYKKYPPLHSDNNFTTLISWLEYSKYKYVYIEDNIIIMSNIKNQIQLRPPSGERNKKLFDQVLMLAKEQDTEYPLGVIDSKTKEWLLKNYPNLEFIPKREYYDYVYLASNLAELPGSAYSKIRNRVNKFKRNYSYSVENISKENMSEIQEFLKRWCLWKDCESDPLLENEKKAILYSMNHYFELGLSGILIRIEDAIEAIAVFEAMDKDTAVVHYEKGSPDFDGIYKIVNQETAKILQKDFKFINRESDMDLPGLRKAKMSYRPHYMIEIFNVTKNSI